MRIVVGGLPDHVTEEGIRNALSPFAPVEAISLAHDSGKPVAVIDLELPREDCEALVRRIHGRLYHGNMLTAWMPAMDW